MGVYIRGMEMPRDCVVCPLGWNGCNHQHDFVYMGERPSDCPLVPVPVHGALMDRDDFFATCPELVDGYKTITDGLVVLPAEEAKE